MAPKQPSVGLYLLQALYRRGLRHLFGIPGDFALNFFKIAEDFRKLKLITLSHEPGLGFAADGLSRIRRQPAAVAITYGAGALNIVNAVACAYAEKSPLIVISGAPGLNERGRGILFHHQAKSLESQVRIFREITAHQAILDDVNTAAEEIDKALAIAEALAEPVYLEIPRDLVQQAIRPAKRKPPFTLPYDAQAGREAAEEVAAQLKKAKRPVIMVGVECRRFGLGPQIVRLAERWRIPVTTSFMGRTAYPIDHPLYAGTYLGPAGHPRVMKLVEDSDCLLLLGVLLADTNMALRLTSLNPTKVVHAISRRVTVGHHSYDHVPLAEWLVQLTKLPAPKLRRPRPKAPPPPRLKPEKYFDSSKATVEAIVQACNRLLLEFPGTPIVADNGDCLFASLDIHSPDLLASGYYATMGFAVPAALGVQLGSGRRPLVLVGDGAFQMTGPELSHAPRLGINPVAVVFNNASWEMLKTIQPEGDYFGLTRWDYARLADIWGGRGYLVKTKRELLQALFAAFRQRRFALLDVRLEPGETSQILKDYLKRIRG
jgi:indolepyruvate decarboxylase